MNLTLTPKKPEIKESKPRQEAKLRTESFPISWKPNRVLPFWRVMRSTSVMGMVVAVPTAMGMATGVWVDTLWPGSHSWFAILAPVGFALGCLSAVFWTCVSTSK